jgi:hypothetical protein
MKKVILVLIFGLKSLLTFAQGQSLMRNEIGFGAFGSSLSRDESRFYILSLRGERRSKLIKNKIGLGLSYNFIKNKNDDNTEFAFGPIVNYHFLSEGKLDPYIGLSTVYSKRENKDGNSQENFQLKYQYGLKFYFSKNFGVGLEISNYKFDGGLLASDNYKRKSGVFPSLGFATKF